MAKDRKDRVVEFIELFDRLSPEDQADSMRRMEAAIAEAAGTATPEQLALVEDTALRAQKKNERSAGPNT